MPEVRPWHQSMRGVVIKVDRTRSEGWIRAEGAGNKKWFFMGHDLTGGLCISKIKKGAGVLFQGLDGPSPRAKKVCPIGVFVVDNSAEED